MEESTSRVRCHMAQISFRSDALPALTTLGWLNRSRLVLLGVILTLGLYSSASQAFENDSNPIVDLDFDEKYSIDQVSTKEAAKKPLYFYLQKRNGGYPQVDPYRFTVDIGTDFQTWLDHRVPPSSKRSDDRSLALEITAHINENVKDKILVSPVAHNGPNHMTVAGEASKRFISFDFLLDPNYEAPNGWALHLQAWQCCSGHPPFAIRVTPSQIKSAPIEFNFVVTNDSLERDQFGVPRSIFKTQIARDRWYHMALELEPRPVGSKEPGRIVVWLNGSTLFDWRGFWGFEPNENSPYTRGLVRDAIGIDLGVYRRRQATTQTILFDHIKFGPTLSSVVSK
ncbi:heparin lyase I family protein [Bradyrhizobium sp. ORS 375]|uniref:heparin lyase I family protein n=1 Tax=Bradyrhizobium sp. (strain ORS 375) TaxID=566679 RepID=UPI00158584EB|nr:heparin lyase I family protein [Bradyrhizobium sp. ORS 375]